MQPRLLLPFLALLAACGTPQEQCIARETRDLRVVDRLIAEAEGNLDRGYALVTVTVWEDVWRWCQDPVAEGAEPGKPYLCQDEVARQETRPKAIDLQEEARKLAQLKAKRQDLSRRAEAAVAQCRKDHPEG